MIQPSEKLEKNSHIKASYYSKKTNLVCLSDDSGLKIGVLNGRPGILSARWGGKNKNFNLAINKIYREILNTPLFDCK